MSNGVFSYIRLSFPRTRACLRFGSLLLFILMLFLWFLSLFEGWRWNVQFTNEGRRPSHRVQHACWCSVIDTGVGIANTK